MAGTTGDGQITLVLGVVIAVLAAVRLQGARVTAGILAVVGGGIVFFDLVNVQGLAQEPTLFGTVEPGFGLYLSLLTAGGILVSVVVAMQDRDGA